MRNGSEDYVYAAVTYVDANSFSIPVSNAGATSGTELYYIPAFSATVVESSGNLTSVAFTTPGATLGSCQLNGFTLYSSAQDGSPVITFPSGIQEGAGFVSADRTKMNMVHIDGLNIESGTSANGAFGQSWNNTTNWNVLTITGAVDSFEKTLIKVTL